VPTDIRRNLTFLREDLLDEAKSASPTAAPSFKLGNDLCNALIAALDEREETSVRAGYRAAQANAATKVTNADLEVRRNYSMSWPQYAREQSQRAELTRQMNNQTALSHQVVLGEWATRAGVLRWNLDQLYRRYREALRQDPNFQKATSNFVSANPAPVKPPQPEGTPATTTAPAANIQGADITITCADKVQIRPLKSGQPTFYDSPKSPPELIQNVSTELSGIQYVSPPMHSPAALYEIHVNQDGVLYVFGCRNHTPNQDGCAKISEWQDATGAIQATGLRACPGIHFLGVSRRVIKPIMAM
jgi:hypothetical protein